MHHILIPQNEKNMHVELEANELCKAGPFRCPVDVTLFFIWNVNNSEIHPRALLILWLTRVLCTMLPKSLQTLNTLSFLISHHPHTHLCLWKQKNENPMMVVDSGSLSLTLCCCHSFCNVGWNGPDGGTVSWSDKDLKHRSTHNSDLSDIWEYTNCF